MYYGRLADYKFKRSREQRVTEIQFRQADDAREQNMDIIVSDTNLNPKTRLKWEMWCQASGYEYREIVINTEPHICITRSLKRDYTVPPHIINKQYVQMRKYLGLPTTYSEPDHVATPTIVVDIDGTVADMTGVRSPFDWDKVGEDLPHLDIIDLVEDLAENHTVIFLSGRDGCCYDDTKAWLESYITAPFHLFMRETKDSRADAIIKEELFDKHIRGEYNVKYVLDDRQQMVDRWRAMGLRCLQVQAGDF